MYLQILSLHRHNSQITPSTSWWASRWIENGFNNYNQSTLTKWLSKNTHMILLICSFHAQGEVMLTWNCLTSLHVFTFHALPYWVRQNLATKRGFGLRHRQENQDKISTVPLKINTVPKAHGSLQTDSLSVNNDNNKATFLSYVYFSAPAWNISPWKFRWFSMKKEAKCDGGGEGGDYCPN